MFLIIAMLRKWNWSWLKVTPRFLLDKLEAKEIPTKELIWSDNLFLRSFRFSILSDLRLKNLVIQDFMSSKQALGYTNRFFLSMDARHLHSLICQNFGN